MWTASREETDRKGGFHQKTKHPGKVRRGPIPKFRNSTRILS